MPIQVYVEVNGRPIESLHIGREKGGTDPDDENDYLILRGGPRPLHDGDTHGPLYRQWTEEGTPFKHRYGDGIEVCVQKGIEALLASESQSEKAG